MNKNLLIIAIILPVVVGGVLYFSLNQNAPIPKAVQPKDETQNVATPPAQSQQQQSRYVVYTKEILENAKESKRALFFFANWCPTCTPADATFKENQDKIPEGVTVIRVNYNDSETDNEEKELAKKYKVTYQHTFVQIDADGKEITKWNGGDTDLLAKNVK